jgi:hypothetical protein
MIPQFALGLYLFAGVGVWYATIVKWPSGPATCR